MPNDDVVKAYFDSDAYTSRNELIPVRARVVREMLSELRAAHILDLGCGDGTVSRCLLDSHNHLTLVDFSPSMIARARTNMPPDALVEFVEHDILTYEPAIRFDAVICIGVLAHVSAPSDVIDRIASALRPGGLALVQITEPRWRGWERAGRRRRGDWPLTVVTRQELVDLAHTSDLVFVRSRRYGLQLPGIGHLPAFLATSIERMATRRGFRQLGRELLLLFQRRHDDQPG